MKTDDERDSNRAYIAKAARHAFHSRHEDDEFVDEITIKVVPRFKQSEMSGDEWRVSATIEMKRKGMVIVERHVGTMEFAAALLPSIVGVLGEFDDRDLIDKAIEVEGSLCVQPGCPEKATRFFRLKAQSCRHGHMHDITFGILIRGFCDKHVRRGDCGLEDADVNYIEVQDPALEVAKALSEDRRDPADLGVPTCDD